VSNTRFNGISESDVRYLPFSFTRGATLAMLARAACDDPGRRSVCVYCGGRVPIRPETPEQTCRCPQCWRRQRISAAPERMRRLSAEVLDELRGTTAWVRRWPER
jgi:hypothetical protein